MKDLIERLERCEGPNFELDCAIFEKMLPTEMFGSKVSSWFRSDDTHYYGCNTEDGYRHLDCLRAPNYTRSVDAALTMLPKGFRWKLGYSRHIPCVAEVVGYRINEPANIGRFVGECDSNHAIALSIAIMKARVHLRDASEQKAVSPEGADGPQHMEACRG